MMSDKNLNRQSYRLKHWNYGWNARYFITICTNNKTHFFGKIADNGIQLSDAGKLSEKLWFEIPNHFPYACLDEFVVMPNHVHGIIIINSHMNVQPVGTRLIASLRTDQTQINDVKIDNKFIQEQHGGFAGDKNPMLQNNISRIIRWYKGRCTFEIKKHNRQFAWQPRFYDHIIRNDGSFEQIRNYIKNNPAKWIED